MRLPLFSLLTLLWTARLAARVGNVNGRRQCAGPKPVYAHAARPLGPHSADVARPRAAPDVNAHAMTALSEVDGTIVSWGDATYGGANPPSGTGFVAVFSTATAFAALHSTGDISVWGDNGAGGQNGPVSAGYTTVYSNEAAFVAVHSAGALYAWGSPNHGGCTDFGCNAAPPLPGGATSVQSVVATDRAFAALTNTGQIEAWGDSSFGGLGAPETGGYTRLFASSDTFVAIKGYPGTLDAWGAASAQNSYAVPAGSDFVDVFSNDHALVGLDSTGGLHAWGEASSGGSLPAPPSGAPFTTVYATAKAFVAMRQDGVRGHGRACAHLRPRLPSRAAGGAGAGSRFSPFYLPYLPRQSLVSWGEADWGGSSAPSDQYTAVFANERAFVALDAYGNVAAEPQPPRRDPAPSATVRFNSATPLALAGRLWPWGNEYYGGSNSPAGSYTTVFASACAFTAMQVDAVWKWWHEARPDTRRGRFLTQPRAPTLECPALDVHANVLAMDPTLALPRPTALSLHTVTYRYVTLVTVTYPRPTALSPLGDPPSGPHSAIQ